MSKQQTTKTAKPVKTSVADPARPQGLGGMCWAEHRHTWVHCTDPIGHDGPHWHTYSQTSR
ncbi:hypothetical protein WBG99_18845 [Streptomyces sp. TG1A-60]|uniref:hypothetical protein n=1 Tax=Streptomyces sp. TG1A-60 TaxID=3129111 RepID=UPI0030D56FD8